MFVLSIIILISRDNIVFILLGWDGLGLSSYVLVVFYQNHSSSASGSITIISNRIGDIFILISIAMLFTNLNWRFALNEQFPLIILTYLIIAALSKRAQFPFSAWLPAAISAPTPISALVHSSTLVTAGVYILIRLINFKHPSSIVFLIIISRMTALYARLSALWENDIKKIIALSTLRQIAMIMFAISLGSVLIAFFHLITHALFKSLIFLCAGIIIHNSSYQDIRHIRSSFRSSPLPASILGLSSIALMGIPFISGFFSKDAIIEAIIASKAVHLISLLIILSIALTSSYSLRLILSSFKFVIRAKPDTNYHPINSLENPIIFISVFSIFSGSSLVWLFNPEQIFFIPNNLKISILLSLLIGVLFSFSSKFKSLLYSVMGEPSVSIWFLHFITSYSTLSFNIFIKKFTENDKFWQEIYGPSYIFISLSSLSKFPNFSLFSTLYILLLSSFLPVIFLI